MLIHIVVSLSLSSVTIRRFLTYLGGILINVLWIFLNFRFPRHLQKYSALVIMLSSQTYVISNSNDLPIKGQSIEGARNLVSIFVVIMYSAVFLNTCWMITCSGIVVFMAVAIVYHSIQLNFPVAPMVVQYVLFTLLITYMTYYTESILKNEFVNSKENESMHQ